MTIYELWYANEWEGKNDLYGCYGSEDAARKAAMTHVESEWWIVPSVIQS